MVGKNFWLILAVILVTAAVFQPFDDTDPPTASWYWGRSGLGLYTDHKTGCQYIKAGYFGGTTPRLNENGKPMCRVDRQADK